MKVIIIKTCLSQKDIYFLRNSILGKIYQIHICPQLESQFEPKISKKYGRHLGVEIVDF